MARTKEKRYIGIVGADKANQLCIGPFKTTGDAELTLLSHGFVLNEGSIWIRLADIVLAFLEYSPNDLPSYTKRISPQIWNITDEIDAR